MNQNFFVFFISGEETRVFPGSRLWQLPLSGEETRVACNSSSEITNKYSGFTIGDYFLAASVFLSENNFSILKSGLEIVSKSSVQTNHIFRITLFLEKHGAFYHPLKVQIEFFEHHSCLFVLNGAVSKSGLLLIEKEYQLIEDLNKAFLKSFLPQVFGVDIIKTDKGNIGFFLGEWFDGYKEFHITDDPGGRQIAIWESDGSRHHISETRALPLYQEISRILTYYYDIESFEQISPWHHAAGDFVVKQDGDTVLVRLITVRGYLPLTGFSAEDTDKKTHILPSLLFFFLELTLRIRLDRLNGTGRMVMLDKQIINSTIRGFLSALDEKSLNYDFGDLRSVFIEFFLQFTLEQIIDLVENILDSCNLAPSEIALLEENFKSHCHILYSIFKII